MAFPKAYKTKLPNGLRIVVVPMKNNPTVTVEVLVETGSLNEKKEEGGISHFLEHMCFKGTTNHPTALAISSEFDSIGAANNAFTGKESTGYWAKTHPAHFEKIVSLLSDLYLRPLLPEIEMEKERGVILQEINMYEDEPASLVATLHDEVLYGDQPAGRPIIGNKKTVGALSRAKLIRYRTRHYVASKTVIVIAGNVTVSHARTVVKKFFYGISTKRAPLRPRVTESQRAPQIYVHTKKTEQTHLIVGVRTMGRGSSREHFALSVLTKILGKSSSSRLFQKLREELGICYYVSAYNSARRDVGTLNIAMGVENNRLDEALRVTLEELKKLAQELVPQNEMKKIQEYVYGRKQIGLETSDALAGWYGGDEIEGLPLITPEEDTQRVQAVTATEVRNVARKFFKNNRLNLTVVGPHGVADTRRLTRVVRF